MPKYPSYILTVLEVRYWSFVHTDNKTYGNTIDISLWDEIILMARVEATVARFEETISKAKIILLLLTHKSESFFRQCTFGVCVISSENIE